MIRSMKNPKSESVHRPKVIGKKLKELIEQVHESLMWYVVPVSSIKNEEEGETHV
jgi:hypothetical protein